MKKVLAAVALAAAIGAPALAEEGFTTEALVAEGFEIRGAATLDAARVVVFLQRSREAARCVVDVTTDAESCVAIHGEFVEQLERREEAIVAVIAFFTENECRFATGEALEEQASAFFVERGFEEDEIDDAAGVLFERGALVRSDGAIELVEGCG